ncbi:hypothetical protein CONLIGDRAFT_671932 [Coniochaeta ligniaria NRRL 30616]|uniref:Lytic polysaccharide monooxygenase n=1 Tax=Coniochaeta ligniaria NRRL 30616 TaxID=1408157 RepID=A0A1J7IG10_9PEZI|nr:hypothetical protein CONLIGDRAFT_671932 [Coniochaeta ligniaria NRRL 30616]
MLFSMKTSTAIAYLAAAGCARGHMFLATPIRFDQVPQVTSGPLLADGSNFPCQAGSSGQYTPKQINNYPLGSQQMIAFIGQAVHGGGSGQALLTYDTAPRPDSVFKVLKSFEGGFVAKGQTGNMGDSASAPDPYTYTFDVPKDIPAGNATVAITWFNKIGNRETYMMCAPIMLTGTGGDKANYDALPDMFTANIGKGCGTQDNADLIFPDPGQFVERNNGATTAFSTATGTGCKTGSGGARPAGSSGGSGGSGASAGSSSAGGSFVTSAAQQPPPASTSAVPGFSGSYSVTAAGGGSAAATTTAPPLPPATTTAVSGNSGSGTGSSSGGVMSGACSSEGEFNCIDGTRFQQCGSGMWSVAMPVAPGTKCTVGRGPSLNVVPAKLRFRGLRFGA